MPPFQLTDGMNFGGQSNIERLLGSFANNTMNGTNETPNLEALLENMNAQNGGLQNFDNNANTNVQTNTKTDDYDEDLLEDLYKIAANTVTPSTSAASTTAAEIPTRVAGATEGINAQNDALELFSQLMHDNSQSQAFSQAMMPNNNGFVNTNNSGDLLFPNGFVPTSATNSVPNQGLNAVLMQGLMGGFPQNTDGFQLPQQQQQQQPQQQQQQQLQQQQFQAQQLLPANFQNFPLWGQQFALQQQQQQQDQLQQFAAAAAAQQQQQQPNFAAAFLNQNVLQGNSQPTPLDMLFQGVQQNGFTAATGLNTLMQNAAPASEPVKPPVEPKKPEIQGPLRALSAYNFFFRDERERILNGPQPDDNDWSDKRQLKLLRAHWDRDRTVKRRHRKSHGKISFSQLSKSISQAWKDLTEEHKNFYREVASKDWERYHRELTQHKLDLTAAAVNESLKATSTNGIPTAFHHAIG